MYIDSSKQRPELSWAWPQTPFKVESRKENCSFGSFSLTQTCNCFRAGMERIVRHACAWHKCNLYLTSWWYKSVLALLEFKSQEILITSRKRNSAMSQHLRNVGTDTQLFYQGMWHATYLIVIKAAIQQEYIFRKEPVSAFVVLQDFPNHHTSIQ